MYQALYRKYRPTTFEDVISQPHITTTLKNQIINGKTAHAYLFTGSRGTGKTTCARIFAKAYLIDSPFVTASVEDMINTHISDDAVHVSEEDRAAWGDKIRCYIAPDDPENIIFTQENE